MQNLSPAHFKALIEQAEHVVSRAGEEADDTATMLVDALNAAQKKHNPDYGDVVVGMALFVASILEAISEDNAGTTPEQMRHVFTIVLGRVANSPSIPAKEKMN